MAFHSNETGESTHVAYAWVYADQATREAATGFVTADLGKLARQTDNDTLWVLTAITPTWVQVGIHAPPGAHATNHSDGGSDEIIVEDLATAGTSGQVPTSDGAGGLTMTTLDVVSSTEHRTLRQLIHFIDNGPAEGFVSGAYREVEGTIFPTAVTWYVDSTKAVKIIEKAITWSDTAPVPTSIEWIMYDTDGSTELATVTDTFVYTNSIFEESRTRVIVVN